MTATMCMCRFVWRIHMLSQRAPQTNICACILMPCVRRYWRWLCVSFLAQQTDFYRSGCFCAVRLWGVRRRFWQHHREYNNASVLPALTCLWSSRVAALGPETFGTFAAAFYGFCVLGVRQTTTTKKNSLSRSSRTFASHNWQNDSVYACVDVRRRGAMLARSKNICHKRAHVK